MSGEEKMEMLTNLYKTVDKLWIKYKNTWNNCGLCWKKDIVIVALVLLYIFL
jgi:hypothetical protein